MGCEVSEKTKHYLKHNCSEIKHNSNSIEYEINLIPLKTLINKLEVAKISPRGLIISFYVLYPSLHSCYQVSSEA